MQRVDRIEKRRFVGREFLLFLWFESEILDATLSTRVHGPFGLWLERRLVLSEGKESTRITAPTPGMGREAKEALLRGQLPESAGIRVSFHDAETSLLLKAESLGFAALKLQTAVDKDDDGPNPLLDELLGKPKGRLKKRAKDDEYEVFYERMALTGELEELFECLYREYLALRLDAAWRSTVQPLLRLWVQGREFPLAEYEALRRSAATPTKGAPDSQLPDAHGAAEATCVDAASRGATAEAPHRADEAALAE